MATVSRLATFWKAFFLVLLGGTLASAANSGEIEAWEAARAQNSADAYYLYLSLFPAGEYVDEAIAALAKLGATGPTREIMRDSTLQDASRRQGGGPYE